DPRPEHRDGRLAGGADRDRRLRRDRRRAGADRQEPRAARDATGARAGARQRQARRRRDEGPRTGREALTMTDSTQQQSREPQEIREDIEQTRTELGETVEALAHKTDVK